ncbi:MAG: FAD-dependent oxidoreductase [Limisphaerales bacterium]
MKLTIDNRPIEIDRDMSIYEAAQLAGVEIPIMCHKPGTEHFTSCMICMVKDKTSGRTVPACSARAADGMNIETRNDEIRAFRKATLELLLSDHVGDCEAPCQRLCTVHLEVPKMVREIMAGDMDAAIKTIRTDMAIPSILERYCNAPCEKGCRRTKYDEGLSIRHLTRFVADWDLKRPKPYIPPRKQSSGKNVAIIGAGATGLAAAYHLALDGHACTVFEKAGRIGGRIEREFKKEVLHDWVLDGELRVLRALGIEFQFNTEVGGALSLDDLRNEYSAVVFVGGTTDTATLESLGLPLEGKSIKLKPGTTMTALDRVFAGGSVQKAAQPLAKSVLAGKTIAFQVSQFLAGNALTDLPDQYNHNMGRLLDGEIEVFISGAKPIPRLKPTELELIGFDLGQAREESTRCMHCDCRKNHDCKLREYSDEYGADQNAFKGEERAKHLHINQNAGAVYEPGKCIKCGLCVRVTAQEGEAFGFTFIGRGFEVKPGVPLNKTLAQGLEKVADQVVEACPTGALSHNEKYDPAA